MKDDVVWKYGLNSCHANQIQTVFYHKGTTKL